MIPVRKAPAQPESNGSYPHATWRKELTMARKEEIERKFRVDSAKLPPLPGGARLVQGYLSFKPNVRVRTEEAACGARKAYLTIKCEGLVWRD